MTNQEIYQSSFVFTLFRVTASLRYIYMDIDQAAKKIRIISYYFQEPSDLEREMMSDIGTDIIGLIDSIFSLEIEFQVTQNDFNQLFKTQYLLYARYEQNVAY